MNQGRYIYTVQVDVQFNQDELNLLHDCTRKHYDASCFTAGRCGGFVYGLRNSGGRGALNTREVDKLCKILEVGEGEACFTLRQSLSRLLSEMNAEWALINQVTGNEECTG